MTTFSKRLIAALAVAAPLAGALPAEAANRSACIINRAWVVWTGAAHISWRVGPSEFKNLNNPFYLHLNEHVCFDFDPGTEEFSFGASTVLADWPNCNNLGNGRTYANDVTFRMDGTAGLIRCTELMGKNLN